MSEPSKEAMEVANRLFGHEADRPLSPTGTIDKVAHAFDAFAAQRVAERLTELTDMAWQFWAQKLDEAVAAEREQLMQMMRDAVARARRGGDSRTVDEYIAGIEADYHLTGIRARSKP